MFATIKSPTLKNSNVTYPYFARGKYPAHENELYYVTAYEKGIQIGKRDIITLNENLLVPIPEGDLTINVKY
jgi:hypothetical protein